MRGAYFSLVGVGTVRHGQPGARRRRRAGHGAARPAARDGGRSDRRRRCRRGGGGGRAGRRDEGGDDRRRSRRTEGHRHGGQPAARALQHSRGVSRFRDRSAPGHSPRPRRQQARGRPAAEGHVRIGHGRPGSAGRRLDALLARIRPDARADRRVVGRSGRDAAAVERSRRTERHDPRGQLRGWPTPAQVADQVHPHHARSVRGRKPLRRRPVHRHHHPAGRRAHPRQRQLRLQRQRAQRPDGLHPEEGPRAEPQLRVRHRRHARREEEWTSR